MLEEENNKDILPENIYKDHLKDLENLNIDLKKLDYFIEKIMSRTNFSKEKSSRLVEVILEELRIILLEGKFVYFPYFGKISRTKNKIVISSKTLLKKLSNNKYNFIFPEKEDYGDDYFINNMLNEEIVKGTSTDNLIVYISCLRNINISNKHNITICMKELLNRNVDLSLFDIKDKEISHIMKNIKDGYIITFSNRKEIEDFFSINEINYLIIDQESCFIDKDIENDLFLTKKSVKSIY